MTDDDKQEEEKKVTQPGLSLLTDKSGNEYYLVKWRNLSVTNSLCVPNNVEDFYQNFKPRPSDIWICAYPKCGTHWLHGILNMLISGKTNQMPSKNVGFIEFSSNCDIESLADPRILSTHLPLKILQEKGIFSTQSSSSPPRVIQIVRDPKDVVVSFYYHTKNMIIWEMPFLGDFGDFLQLFLDGLTETGAYVDYMAEWWPFVKKNEAAGGILLLTYENMKENLSKNINEIVNFLGLKEKLNDKFIEEVIKKAEFVSMREIRAKDSIIHFNSQSSGGMYRKGIVGDWQNHFSIEEKEKFDKFMKEKLGHLNIPYFH